MKKKGKTMKKRMLSLLFATVLLLGSCSPNTDTDAKQPETDTVSQDPYVPQEIWADSDVYKVVPLIPETGPYAGETLVLNEYIPMCILPMEDGIRLVDWNHTEDKGYTDIFDWEGNHLGTETLTETDCEGSLSDMLPDGTMLYEANDYVSEFSLHIVSPEGKTTVSCTLPQFPGFSVQSAFCGNNVVVTYDDKVQLYDMSLQLQKEYTISGEIDILYEIRENLLYYQDWNGEIYSLDLESGAARRQTSFMPEGILRLPDRNEQFMDAAGNIYDLQEEGIFRYTADEKGVYTAPETEEPFLAWGPSGLRMIDVEVLSILDGDHFLIRFSGNMDEKAVYAVLSKDYSPAKADRQEITMMMFDTALADTLRTAAYVFNRENTEYYITILESDLKTSDEKVTEIVFQEFSEGRVPDLLVFNEDMESLFLNLDRQGYLSDLSSFAPLLTGSAEAAVSNGDGLKRIPMHIWYNTLVSSETEGSLTIEELARMAASLGEDEVLFSDQVYNRLSDVIQSAFVDKAAGTCHFDTEEFRTFLEILQNRDGYFAANGSMFGEQYSEILAYQITDAVLMDNIAEDRIRLVHLPLYNYKAYGMAKICFDDKAFSICGYPGMTAVPQFVTSLAVPEAADCPEGAAAFLEFILSDTVQTSSRIIEHAFPVTSSAVDKLLEKDWFIYSVSPTEHTGAGAGREYTSVRVDSQVSRTEPDMETWELYMDNLESRRLMIQDGLDYLEIEYTPAETEALRTLLEDPGAGRINDPMLQEIILEEISAWHSGDRTMEDTIRVLQSRVSTYLAE